MTPFTFTNVERLEAAAGELDVAFEMDEDAFRAFYDRTARPLWAYLARITGDRQTADDLLQEAYYRLLRVKVAHADESHRRHYLFKIATNLARDGYRRRAAAPPLVAGSMEGHATERASAVQTETRLDLSRAFGRLKRRERELLWLAYAQGSSHEEIGAALGLKTGSIKPLLFRARQKLAALLHRDRTGGSRAER
jgi:RNA polymerase sigma-70 factor (ECF subfamily)